MRLAAIGRAEVGMPPVPVVGRHDTCHVVPKVFGWTRAVRTEPRVVRQQDQLLAARLDLLQEFVLRVYGLVTEPAGHVQVGGIEIRRVDAGNDPIPELQGKVTATLLAAE